MPRNSLPLSRNPIIEEEDEEEVFCSDATTNELEDTLTESFS